MKESTLTQRTVSGGVWLFVRRLTTNIIRLVCVAILARKLSPSDFGIVALASVLLSIITLTGETGIKTYVIYDRQHGWQDRVNSAFWLNSLIASGQVITFLLAVPFLHIFFPDPRLAALMFALTGVLVFRQMSVVFEGLAEKELNYKILALRDTVSDVAAATLGVAMALHGWGVWSLVVPQLVFEPLRLIYTSVAIKWLPRLSLGVENWRQIWRYCSKLIGSQFLGLFLNDGDTILVGKLLGSASLGIYNLAWQLSNIVGRNISTIASSLAMSSLSIVKDNNLRLLNNYRRMVHLLAALSFPSLLGMFAIADDIVALMFGDKWMQVSGLLRVFIVFTIVRSITSPCSIIYNLKRRTGIGLKQNLLTLPIYISSIYIGSYWGIWGVALGVTIVRTGGALASFVIAGKLLEVSLYEEATILLRLLSLSVFTSITAWALKLLLVEWRFATPWRVLACTALGGTLYAVGLRIVEKKLFYQVVGLAQEQVVQARNQVWGFVRANNIVAVRSGN